MSAMFFSNVGPMRVDRDQEVREGGREGQAEEGYDAVVVCNGHYAKARVPDFPGQAEWPGRQMHSHNYRSPDAFKGAQVVVVGVSASGEDISREIADVADQVHHGFLLPALELHVFIICLCLFCFFPFWVVRVVDSTSSPRPGTWECEKVSLGLRVLASSEA